MSLHARTLSDAEQFASPDDIELLAWPVPPKVRAELRERGSLCLYLVPAADVPPDDLRPTEDWVRADADPVEVHWRIRRLQADRQQRIEPPQCRDGCIFYRGVTVVLPPSCERIAELLCDHYDGVVPSARLINADSAPLSAAALNTRLHRIRQLVEPAGLSVTNVRARGYVLHTLSAPQR